MRGPMKHALFASLVLAVTACSLGALDGYSGGAGGEGPPDATPVADSGSSSDGGSEVDARVDDGGDAGSFCSTVTPPATVCADFDRGMPAPEMFNASTKSGSAVVDDDGFGGTKGLALATTPEVAADSVACLRTSLPKGAKSVSVELQMKADQIGQSDFDFLVVGADGDHEIGLHAIALGTIEFEEDKLSGAMSQTVYTPTSKRLEATYRHLRFVITRTATASHAELFIDGVSVGTHEGDPYTLDNVVYVEIGDCVVASAAGWKLHADNVVLRVE